MACEFAECLFSIPWSCDLDLDLDTFPHTLMTRRSFVEIWWRNSGRKPCDINLLTDRPTDNWQWNLHNLPIQQLNHNAQKSCVKHCFIVTSNLIEERFEVIRFTSKFIIIVKEMPISSEIIKTNIQHLIVTVSGGTTTVAISRTTVETFIMMKSVARCFCLAAVLCILGIRKILE